MGDNRFFSDSTKLEVIKNNLKKNNGLICCEICGMKMNSIEDCHFDHIYPYSKGGKSTFDNCQILCSTCNLRKNDKELQDFVLDEKAKQFMSGKMIEEVASDDNQNSNHDDAEQVVTKSTKMSKEEFDLIIARFIDKKGDIHKVDFTRSYNNLPSYKYVQVFYGDLKSLKKSFGIEDRTLNWNRETIKKALLEYVTIHGDVSEKDLKKKNGLPSYPCILKYYSDYSSFSLFKQKELGIEKVYKLWTRQEIIDAGKAFVEVNFKLTEKDLKSKNGLPTSKVIYNHFGTINDYQRAIGAPITESNDLITKDQIEAAVDEYFDGKDRVVESRKEFFKTFPYKISTIYKRYGSIEEFCSATGIKIQTTKKASYTKKEIDDAVHNWIFSGKEMPKAKDLTANGLPSMASIMKYYEHWKEPFVIYKKIYDEANRNT